MRQYYKFRDAVNDLSQGRGRIHRQIWDNIYHKVEIDNVVYEIFNSQNRWGLIK